jgi:hypothetical protein
MERITVKVGRLLGEFTDIDGNKLPTCYALEDQFNVEVGRVGREMTRGWQVVRTKDGLPEGVWGHEHKTVDDARAALQAELNADV